MRTLWGRSKKTMMLFPYGTVISPYIGDLYAFRFRLPDGFKYGEGQDGSLTMKGGSPSAEEWIVQKRKSLLK